MFFVMPYNANGHSDSGSPARRGQQWDVPIECP